MVQTSPLFGNLQRLHYDAVSEPQPSPLISQAPRRIAANVSGGFHHLVQNPPLPDIEPGPPAVHMIEFPRELLIRYTPLWDGERFPDGRPKVPDEIINRLKEIGVTSEEVAWGPLRIVHNYRHQWAGATEGVPWVILNPTRGLIGRAFTCEYMPGRHEIADVIEGEAREKGQSGHNKRMMDMLRPGDVLVCDMAGGEGGVAGILPNDLEGPSGPDSSVMRRSVRFRRVANPSSRGRTTSASRSISTSWSASLSHPDGRSTVVGVTRAPPPRRLRRLGRG
jgi:hypothetical protein